MRQPKRSGGTPQQPQRKTPVAGGGAYILDKNLVSRVEAYMQRTAQTDVDAIANALRVAHKEYSRRPQAAFRVMVSRAVRAVQSRSQADAGAANGNTPTSSSLGAAESDGSQDSSDEGEDSDSGDESASGSSSGEEGSDSQGGEDEGAGGDVGSMNNMLASLYAARTPQPSSGDAKDAKTSSANNTTNVEPGRAFAPPEIIAAAAARAAAAEKAKTSGKSAGTSKQTTPSGTPAPQQAPATTAPGTNTAHKDASAANQVNTGGNSSAADFSTLPGSTGAMDALTPALTPSATPAPGAIKQGARTAIEAGLATEPRGGAAAKRARRMGATPGGNAGPGQGGSGKQRSNSAVVTARPVTYADLGGVEDVLADIRELIEYPLKHPEVYSWLGVEPPRGVLLHGPPGCGKTALANAIANECGVPFLRVSAPEIVSGMSGESEAKLRSLFQEAAEQAPCIVFIDEIDAIAPKRETAQREMERRIVAQMLTCMDDLSAPVNKADSAGQPHDRQDGADGNSAMDPDAEVRIKTFRPHVVVIGATNRPDALDPALRRAGRFDREITLGIPTESARAKILQVITRGLRLEGDFDFKKIAKRTPGFVGADLMALVKEAAALAVTRIFSTLSDDTPTHETTAPAAVQSVPAHVDEPAPMAVDNDHPVPSQTAAAPATESAPSQQPSQAVPAAAAGGATQPRVDDDKKSLAVVVSLAGKFGGGPLTATDLQGLAISMSDFEIAVSKVQPSVRREGFATTPDVTWDDVGSLHEVREELSFSITHPIMYPERFEALGMSTATGVLLYGPPGCGKTLVAKAVAHESGANFISIKGPELLNKYVGESERAVRQLFSRARAAHPCVLFFDELDALAPRRGTDTNQAAERVVNQLLTEMDGVDGRSGVYVVAATNRPDMIDPALLRPGRLDKVLYVPLPPPDGRASILAAASRRTPLAGDVDIAALGLSDRLTGFSGADLAALVREASVLALKEAMKRDMAFLSSGTAPPSSSVADTSSSPDKKAGDGSVATTQVPAAAPGVQVHMRHFQAALSRISPSVSKRDAKMYDTLRKSLQGNLRSRLESTEVAGEEVKILPEAAGALPTAPVPEADNDPATMVIA